MKLLAVSNGHGEDMIAVRILEQLQQLPNPPQLAALPLVGEGHAYRQRDLPIVSTVQQMPSGGFVYMDKRQLWRDLQGGLLSLTGKQIQALRHWAQEGGKILAVGDILPLLLAWLSGADYAFVGTAKSEYYLRDETDWLPSTSKLERWLGSFYYPWERGLLSCDRCQAVFPRDSLTAQSLRHYGIPAHDLGNPMMDGLDCPERIALPLSSPSPSPAPSPSPRLTVLLLPGSRSPEAEANWHIILQALPSVHHAFAHQPLLFLLALAPGLNRDRFLDCLLSQEWQAVLPRSEGSLMDSLINPLISIDPDALTYALGNRRLIITQNAYAPCLQIAQMAIALAGTATEQFVGLGKPAITLSGEGPQFTATFAEAQTRLLGCSVVWLQTPGSVGVAMKNLWNDPKKRAEIFLNGQKRMGKPGAALRIAQALQTTLLQN